MQDKQAEELIKVLSDMNSSLGQINSRLDSLDKSLGKISDKIKRGGKSPFDL